MDYSEDGGNGNQSASISCDNEVLLSRDIFEQDPIQDKELEMPIMQEQQSFADDESDIDYDDDQSKDQTHDCESSQDDTQDSANSNQPLYKGSRLTVAVSMLLIVTFTMRHGLSGEALSDLLTLIELHCLADNLCCSTLKMYKDFFMKLKSPLVYIYYCQSCSNYIGNEKNPCNICQKTPSTYFLTIPLIYQLQELLQSKYPSSYFSTLPYLQWTHSYY